jgi:hypothetical protein
VAVRSGLAVESVIDGDLETMQPRVQEVVER